MQDRPPGSDKDEGTPKRQRTEFEAEAGSPRRPKRDRPAFPGHEYLGFDSPGEVLRHVSKGDPLGFFGACEERLVERALLLDQRRLVLRAMARAAYSAPGYLGKPALDVWMPARIDEAIADLLREDREDERAGKPPTEPWDNRYAFLSEAMGVEARLVRRICILLNDLEDEPRRAFFHLVVLKKSVHRYVAEGNGPPDRVKESLRAALRRLSEQTGAEAPGEDDG